MPSVRRAGPAFALLLLVLSVPTGAATPPGSAGFAPAPAPAPDGGHDALVARHFGPDASAGTPALAWDRLHAAWRATPDLDRRIEALAEPAPRSPEAARARLGLHGADLAAHRLLARAVPGRDAAPHAAALEALVARVRASGDGTEGAPWSVASRDDALVFLEARGLEPVGGYYTAPRAHALLLRVHARPGDTDLAADHWFDLSAVFSAWRTKRAHALPAARLRPEHLIEAFAGRGDAFARASVAVDLAQRKAAGSELAAARRLREAVAGGNGAAWYLLGDLYEGAAEHGSPARRARARSEAERAWGRAAELGIAYGHYRLGGLALDRGARTNALKHLELAAAADYRPALRELAWALGAEAASAEDRDRVLDLLRRAADGGGAEDRYSFARWALLESASPEPHPEALAALRANVAARHPPSLALLGDLHARGRHVPEDPVRAHGLWLEAADLARTLETLHGVARALLANAAGPLHDPEAALRLLEPVLRHTEAGRHCLPCHATWGEALLAAGRRDEARAVLGEALARAERREAEAVERRVAALLARLPGAGEILASAAR
jgi:TPR repeat protein